MRKNPLDLGKLEVDSFDVTPVVAQFAVAGLGTACFETCKTDPTSDPDAETCGGNAGIDP